MSKLIPHRLHSRRVTRGQAGDTLVEVLISIAVISLVLTVGYATTNRNVAANQDTQERSQALQIAQRQTELLRAVIQNSADTYSAGDRCMDGAAMKFSSDTAYCAFDHGGNASCASDPCFNVAITLNAATGAYHIGVQWASIRGGTSNVGLDYRI